MNKGIHDLRTLSEFLGSLLGERTSYGDIVSLKVQYNGSKKPTCTLFFTTNDRAKQRFPSEEEFSAWLPDTPGRTQKYGDGTENINAEIDGFRNWEEYVRNGRGLRGTLEKVCNVRGLRFSFDDGKR